jgi:hypothetical protein
MQAAANRPSFDLVTDEELCNRETYERFCNWLLNYATKENYKTDEDAKLAVDSCTQYLSQTVLNLLFNDPS